MEIRTLNNMTQECPCCEREFERLEHFPRILLVNFERVKIPKDKKFPYLEERVFFEEKFVEEEPSYKHNNNKLPPEIEKKFKRYPHKLSIMHKGYIWLKTASPFDKICEGQPWARSYNKHAGCVNKYIRTELDQKKRILDSLNPYFESLEELIGQEVKRASFLPSFKKNLSHKNNFYIPNANYCLQLYESSKVSEHGIRIVKLNITKTELSDHKTGTINYEMKHEAKVAELEYKGMIK